MGAWFLLAVLLAAQSGDAAGDAELARVEDASLRLAREPWHQPSQKTMLRALASPHRRVALLAMHAIWQHSIRGADPDVLFVIARSSDPELRETGLRLLLVNEPTYPQEIPLLREQLHSADSWNRRMAARKLASVGPRAAPALPDLVPLARSEDPQERQAAVRAIGAIDPGPEGLLEVVEATRDTDPTVRAAGAAALAARTDPNAPVILAGLLADPDWATRMEAIRALAAHLPGTVAMDAMLDALGSPFKDVRDAADGILVYDRKVDSRAIFRALLNGSPARRRALLPITARHAEWERLRPEEIAKGVPALRGMLADSSGEARAAILTLIGRAGNGGAADAAKLLTDPDPEVRRAATVAVGWLQKTPGHAADVAPHLLAAIRSGGETERREAAELLTLLADAPVAVIEAVSLLLASDDPVVRDRAARFMRIQGPSGAAELARATLSPDVRARRVAAAALGADLGGYSIGLEFWPEVDIALAALTGALDDPDAEVRRAAAASLGSRAHAAAPAAAALRVALGDPVQYVRIAAGRALRRIDGFALRHLVAALESPRPRERLGAAESLGTLYQDGADARVPLEKARRDDPDPAVRRAAAVALRKIASPAVFAGHIARDARARRPTRGAVGIALRIVVAPDGTADDVMILHGSDPEQNLEELRRAARERYEPGRIANVPTFTIMETYP